MALLRAPCLPQACRMRRRRFACGRAAAICCGQSNTTRKFIDTPKNLLGRIVAPARCGSWVIWSTSVTVESEGSFLSVFVFFEGQ